MIASTLLNDKCTHLPLKKFHGQPIKNVFNEMTTEQQVDLNTQFARAIYHSGAALYLILLIGKLSLEI